MKPAPRPPWATPQGDESPAPSSPRPVVDPVQDDLAAMDPDMVVTLSSGRSVRVREFSALEALRLEPQAAVLVQALRSALGRIAETEDLDLGIVMAAMSHHADEYLALLEVASGVTREEYGRLTDAEGLRLMQAFWAVNVDFFGRRLALAIAGGEVGRIVAGDLRGMAGRVGLAGTSSTDRSAGGDPGSPGPSGS